MTRHLLMLPPTRGARVKGLLASACLLGAIPIARGAHNAGVETSPAPSLSDNSRTLVRRALREFDRFLDHHPLMEEQLRQSPQLTADATFLDKSPELEEFFAANPKVVEGLAVYPRYFLNRALMRQASAPVTFADLAPFKELFQQQPALQVELNRNPELVRDPAFQQSHPALINFFGQHPALARVFSSSTLALNHQ